MRFTANENVALLAIAIYCCISIPMIRQRVYVTALLWGWRVAPFVLPNGAPLGPKTLSPIKGVYLHVYLYMYVYLYIYIYILYKIMYGW